MPHTSLDDAVTLILAAMRPVREVETIDLRFAGNRVLAEAVLAREPHPAFSNSSVDGYAIARGTVGHGAKIVGESVAGDRPMGGIAPGEAVRIFTGAPVPEGTGYVLMQEDTEVGFSFVRWSSEPRSGQFIRSVGDEFAAGDGLLEIGSRLGPGAVGLLAAQGVFSVSVFRSVRVGVISTGAEVTGTGSLLPGQIRDANGPMLRAALQAMGIGTEGPVIVNDQRAAWVTQMREFCESCDCVLVSGGASVGDRDFLASVVDELGEVKLHGVAVRPGKPFLFGSVMGKPIFGLPGNPASAFVGFRVFVADALRVLGGEVGVTLRWLEVPIGFHHEPHGREEIVRARWVNGEAVLAGEQASYGLRSLADGELLVRLPGNRTAIAGDRLPAIWL